jgi:hypothetical protein
MALKTLALLDEVERSGGLTLGDARVEQLRTEHAALARLAVLFCGGTVEELTLERIAEVTTQLSSVLDDMSRD